MQAAANCFHVPPKSVHLGAFEISVFETRNPVLTYIECVGQLHLSNAERLSKLAKLIRANLLEHPALVVVNGGTINGPTHQNLVYGLSHQFLPFRFSR